MDQQKPGFDVLIITVNNRHQAHYWESCLESQRGELFPKSCRLLTVVENWPEGAGNCLGTLNAYQQARYHSRLRWGGDLLDLQRQGAAIAIIHAAGQGKRMAPFSIADYGNKSALKMPEIMHLPDGSTRLLTLLEAVIRHTTIYAPFRQKRLSVFWGDQLCIPHEGYNEVNSHHIMIATRMHETIDADMWQILRLNDYGVLLRDGIGNAQMAEKIDYESFSQLLKTSKIRSDGGVGMSYGSFSLSLAMTEALLEEFAEDLRHQKNNMDCEPHVWMPLTLSRDIYLQLMAKKEPASSEHVKIYERMQRFKQTFMCAHASSALLGVNDLGPNAYWWDFGSLSRYYNNLLHLLDQDREAQALRSFFSIPSQAFDSEKQLLQLDCHVRQTQAHHSILLGVTAGKVNLQDSIMIDVTTPEIESQQGFGYKVCEPNQLTLSPEGCCADLCLPRPQQHYRLYTQRRRNGKNDWKERLPHNPFSYAECSLLCADVDLFEAETLWNKRKEQIKIISDIQ